MDRGEKHFLACCVHLDSGEIGSKEKIRWALAFVAMVVVILVMNYVFLIHVAPASQLKKLSLDLSDGNRAEMYVRENEKDEIIAYSPLRIVNRDDVILDEAESLTQACYKTIISKMVADRSLDRSVCEEEKILANPKNVMFEYEGGVYTVSVDVLLKHILCVALVLVIVCGIKRFTLYRLR